LNFNFDPKLKAIVGDWFNGPLAIDPSYIDYMIKTINTVELMPDGGLFLEKQLPFQIANLNAKKTEGFVQAGTAAIINVQGPISYRPASNFFRWLFGGTSYAEILDSFRAAKVSDKVSQIVFNFDSPGGTVVGFEEAINEIYEGRSSKKIISYVNPYAASAAFGLASAGHEIHAMSSSGYGSIGTVMMHLDQSKYDEKLGATWTPIFAGDKKVDGNQHFPLSERAKKRFQEIVDKFYSQFVSAVARNRGVSEKDVRKTEAELYYGDEGISIGLIDSVVNGFDVPEQSSSSYFYIREQEGGHGASDDPAGDNAENAHGDIHLNNNQSTNQTEVTMTLEELKAKDPELFKQIQQEAVAPLESKVSALEKENGELKAQNEKLTGENADMGNRVKGLEEKDILRTEAEMRSHADSIWSIALSKSDVPPHLHTDIRSFVSHGKFVANGQFDEKGFTDAVNAKIKDWEDKGVRSTVILGSGVPVSGALEQRAHEEKEDNEAVDALVALATK
jgi:capsid assembly protease